MKSFSVAKPKKNHPPLVFNTTSVSQSSSLKNLGLILDSNLIFDEHLKMLPLKINKTLRLFRKLHNLLPRSALITRCKACVRPYLDYGHIFMIKLIICPLTINWKSVQYKTCLTITGAIGIISKEKLYEELGLESLQLRRWYRKLGMFLKNLQKQKSQKSF